MDIHDLKAQERKLREQRTIEAIRKNLMGISGKLGTIARGLGYPIIRQGSVYFHESSLPDMFEFEEGEILMAEDQATSHEGYHFDGLSRGQHLEITYRQDTRLKVYHKGYLVYDEIAGDLFTYTPHVSWEEIVDNLYPEAVKRLKGRDNNMIEKVDRKVRQFIWELKTRWGL